MAYTKKERCVENMKKRYVVIFLLILMFFISGCQSELFSDPNFSKDKIKFNSDIVINYGEKNVDTTKFVSGIDDIKIKDSNRLKDELRITVDNYSIICPEFDADELGKHVLVYSLGDYRYKVEVTVKDITAPLILLQNNEIDLTVGEKFSKKNLDYKIKDNLSKKKDIKISIKGDYNSKKSGKYNLKLVAKDEAGNKSSVDFVLNIYEKASLEIDKTNISLNIGETLLVSAKVKGKDQTVNWTSDNNTIVVVDNGKITAVAPGTAIIRVTCGNLAKEINVNVKAKETNNNANSQNSNNNKNSANNSSSGGTGGNKVTNPSQYNKYFSGVSIATYNEALSYAEGKVNSGVVNSYSLMPDGKGYQVTFG